MDFPAWSEPTNELVNPADSSDAHLSAGDSHFQAVPLFDWRLKLHRGVPFSEWYAGANMSPSRPANEAAKRIFFTANMSVQRVIRQGIQEWHNSTSVTRPGKKSVQSPKTYDGGRAR